MKHRVDKGVLSMKKGFGYLFAIGGLILLVIGLGYFSLDPLLYSSNYTNATLNETSPLGEIVSGIGKVPSYILTVVGAGLIVLGVLVLYKSPQNTKVQSEVPIYSGNQIIGYRRH